MTARRWLPPVLGAVVLVLVAGNVLLVAGRAPSDPAAERDALEVARRVATELVGTDPERAGERFSRLSDAATGEFGRQLRSRSDTFVRAVQAAGARSVGSVAEAGITQVDEQRAVVLVAADATVRDIRTPDGVPHRYRMKLTLEHGGDRWLVAKLEFVP